MVLFHLSVGPGTREPHVFHRPMSPGRQAADAEPDADAPMPDRSAADAPVAAPDAAETAGETPVVPVPSTTVACFGVFCVCV